MDEIPKIEMSPVKRLTERTTTITVPLKGGDDTPPAAQKKGRGRPRKSLDGPVNRSGTPRPKAGGGRKTFDVSPRKQEIDLQRKTATPPKKPKRRQKKSMGLDVARSSSNSLGTNDSDVWLGSSVIGGEEMVEKSKTPRTRSRGRRQEITPRKIAGDLDVDSQSSSVDVVGDHLKKPTQTIENRHGERDQIGQRLSQPYEVPVPDIEKSSMSRSSCEQSALGQDESSGRSMISRDNCSPCAHIDDTQDQAESDQTDPHQDFDSILESEGFSMVSVSSLPSVGNNPTSPPQQCGSMHDFTPTIISSPVAAPAPEPTKIQSSSRQLEVPSDGTPKLEKVVRAGIALQGVLGTEDQSPKLGSQFQESQKASPLLSAEKSAPQREFPHRVAKDQCPEEHPDDPFSGFGAGTRRELKAGLRLGEELAKRQRQISQNLVASPKEADDVLQRATDFSYPQLPSSDSKEGCSLGPSESRNQVRYPLLSNNQLPSPQRSLIDEEEDRMSWRANTPIKQEESPFTSAPILVSEESVGDNTSAIDFTMMARKEEWQREREAVSRQIEMANKSQVIIIDSDDEEEGHREDLADNDIWQAEAQSVDQFEERTPDSDFSLRPEIVKPRRSKLPSPWRRNSQIIYSDEMEPTESDLFWQPDQSQARASKRLNSMKDRIHDHSDITAVSILDNSLENTRKAEAQIQVEASKDYPGEDLILSNDEETESGTSARQGSPGDSVQHDEEAPHSPVTPSEDHDVPELCTSPKETSMRNVIELSKKTATLEVTKGTSKEPVSKISDSKALIDPRLFQKETRSSASKNPIHPVPIQPSQPPQSSISWLSRLTAPIWSIFAPASSLPRAATKEDILCSSPHEPLCQLTPWEECHFRALGPLYYGSLLYGAHLFPFNPNSPSARYCGAYVTTKLGWSRKIKPEDCGITDAFMVLLDERGFALGEPGARWIDERLVITMCVALWVGMVKRGEIEVEGSKGEIIGLRDQGDRKWTKDDIDWAGNQSAYFERKRREFNGLPSVKNKT